MYVDAAFTPGFRLRHYFLNAVKELLSEIVNVMRVVRGNRFRNGLETVFATLRIIFAV